MMKKKIMYNGKLINYDEYLNSIQWRRLRHQAKIKYGFKCEHCGNKKLQVHHHNFWKKYPPYDFKDDNINDLLICCPKCHKLHHGKREEEKLQMKITKFINKPQLKIIDFL